MTSIALLFVGSGAFAAPVTFAFGGQITGAFGSIEGEASLPFAVGNTVTATITFDSEAVDSDPSSGAGTYAGPTAGSISVGGLEFFYDFVDLTVSCNVAAYCPESALEPLALFVHQIVITASPGNEQLFLVNTAGWFPDEPDAFSNVMAPMFEIYLEHLGGAVFDPQAISTDDLPLAAYDLGLLSFKAGQFRWRTPPSSATAANYRGSFTIDSMVLVPAASVPSMNFFSLGLVAILLAGLGFRLLPRRPCRPRVEFS